jgi:hypothetical protein
MTKLPKHQWFNEDVPSDSPVIDELRRLQKEAGYKSPRTLREERQKERLQKKEAGETSGYVRAARERLRRDIVLILYGNLDSAYRNQPFSTKSIEALHDEFLKVLYQEQDNVLDALFNWFVAPLWTTQVERLHDKYEQDNFLDAVSNFAINLRKQQGRDRDALDEGRARFILQTWLGLRRLSESDLQILSRVSLETLKKDLQSMNIRGRQRTRRSG